MQTFAFGAHTTLTPRLSADYGLGEKAHIHVAYANYAQMPPYACLLAYQVNQGMEPMRVVHEIAGLEVGFVPASQVRLEAYNKVYRDIPASTEYSPVTMHTMVDMIGEQSVWLPMTSEGRGEASGIELSDRSRIGSRVQLMGSVAYARARFAGRDGVLRPSNFDFPWIVNASGVVRLGRGMIGSGRYGYATGRPYTPFDMAQSAAQNRPVYDLARVNGARAPFYSRLDLQVSKEMLVRGQRLEIYLGVDNVAQPVESPLLRMDAPVPGERSAKPRRHAVANADLSQLRSASDPAVIHPAGRNRPFVNSITFFAAIALQ